MDLALSREVNRQGQRNRAIRTTSLVDMLLGKKKFDMNSNWHSVKFLTYCVDFTPYVEQRCSAMFGRFDEMVIASIICEIFIMQLCNIKDTSTDLNYHKKLMTSIKVTLCDVY